jgi:hypothetical protein
MERTKKAIWTIWKVRKMCKERKRNEVELMSVYDLILGNL